MYILLKKLLLFILIAGIIEFFGIYMIVKITYNEEGDYRDYASWAYFIMDIFEFILFFPFSFIEFILESTGHIIWYSSSTKGTAMMIGIYLLNLIMQFYIILGIKILWKRIRQERNKQSST